MLLLNQLEVIVDLVGAYIRGHLPEMPGQFGQVAAVATKRAFALSGNYNFLLQLFVKWAKPFYLRTSLFDEILFFFIG